MANGFASPEVLLNGATQTVGASASNQVVSKIYRLQNQDSLYHRVDIKAGAVTGAPVAKLQHTFNGIDWFDAKTVVLVTGTTNTLTFMPEVVGDQAYLPLRTEARIVVSSAGGEAASITSILRSFYG